MQDIWEELNKLYESTEITVKITKDTAPGSTKVIFYKDNIEIGCASVLDYLAHNDFVYNVEVKKEFRGQGYGKYIMNYMLEHYPIEWLEVNKDNIIAQNLYAKFGFKIICNTRVEEEGKSVIRLIMSNREGSKKQIKAELLKAFDEKETK